MAVGDAAQGFVVDPELREGRRDFTVTPGKFRLAGRQCLRFLAQAPGVVELLGGEQGAAKKGERAESEQSIANLRNVVVVAVGFGGELLARWFCGQQMQVQ